ncbi:hypothetical protein ACFTUC_19805 [Streptomyces sp. NPDC056944]|uniref:hypothetical protein n=1 Tax=Streptomyces sp. NPDC056944 TaxID=3345972 RepID=UPI0036402B34
MTTLRTPLTAAVGLALAGLLATGCTDGAPAAAPSPSATGKPPETRSPRAGGEHEQGERAKAALSTVSPDDPEFVASGLERVRDGAHDRSPLTKGKTYRVSVACVGTGNVKVVIADGAPRSLPCDGASTGRRVTLAAARLPIDITGTSGATGMVAWQIVSVPS